MAFERQWLATPAKTLTLNGGTNGLVTVGSTSGLKAKQVVKLEAAGVDTQNFEVKRVLSDTTLYVGPVDKNIKSRSDVSAYTTAANATIQGILQKRNDIPREDRERSVYEEEPTLAKRVILVDEYGNFLDAGPEQINGNVAVAGVPNTVAPTSGKHIQTAFIACNSVVDPWNPNAIGDAIRFSLDDGTTWTTLMAGESQHIPGIYNNVQVDTNINGTLYQVILWS